MCWNTPGPIIILSYIILSFHRHHRFPHKAEQQKTIIQQSQFAVRERWKRLDLQILLSTKLQQLALLEVGMNLFGGFRKAV